MNKFIRALERDYFYHRQRPYAAHLELTYRCNLNCEFCSIPQMREPAPAELTTGQWRSVIAEICDAGAREVVLIGAEPLMRRDVGELIRAVKNKNMFCLLVTNGMLLDRKTAQLVTDMKLDKISISLDGPEQIHDAIRGKKGIYRKVTEAIRTLTQVKSEKNTRYPRVEIHCTLCSLNAAHINAFIGGIKDVGAEQVSFQYLSETPAQAVKETLIGERAAATAQFIPKGGSLLFSGTEAERFKKDARGLLRGKIGGFSLRSVCALSTPLLVQGQFPIKKCYFVSTHTQIDPYGNIVPCAMLQPYKLGNVTREAVGKIWNGKSYKALRSFLHKRFFPICRYCCHFKANLTFRDALAMYCGRELK